MANTPASTSSAPVQPLEMQQLISTLATAIGSFTPEGIAASGAALQSQLQITGDMQAQLAEAKATLAAATETKEGLDEQTTSVAAAKKSLDDKQAQYQADCKTLDARIQAFNNNQVEQADQQSKLDAYAKTLAGREADVSKREGDVLGRERAVLGRERAVSDKEAMLGNTLKQLSANATATQ